MNYTYEYFDREYADSVNYDGRQYYNNPITITVNGVKYVTGFGTRDKKYHKVEGNTLYIVGINSGLDYASLLIIDITAQTVSEANLNITDQKFYEWDVDKQIRYLEPYIIE